MSDMPPSDTTPLPELRFLKILVTALAVTMILGLITIVGLLVIRLRPGAGSAGVLMPALPAAIALPEGARALSLSFAEGRIVVLTADDRVLVYAPDGALIGQTQLAP